jgi:hypothetical protein
VDRWIADAARAPRSNGWIRERGRGPGLGVARGASAAAAAGDALETALSALPPPMVWRARSPRHASC